MTRFVLFLLRRLEPIVFYIGSRRSESEYKAVGVALEGVYDALETAVRWRDV